MAKKTVADIEVKDHRVLMRVDFNVPLDAQGGITDDRRIRMALPSIMSVLDRAGKLILMSHLGRPKGKPEQKFSLAPAAKRLGELLGMQVDLAGDCVGPAVAQAVQQLKPGQCLLLENLRFHEGETKNDPDFSAQLAGLADLYVNDAFGTAHRQHASMYGVPEKLGPGRRVCGFLIQKELEYLGQALDDPAPPFLAILGGAKVSDKIPVIENLSKKVDAILIGGAMSYTFLKAQGKPIGNSKLEEDKLGLAAEILQKAKEANKEILLPIDHVVVDKIDRALNLDIVGENIPDGKIAVDIGPKTVALFEKRLQSAKTIVWNGPLGIFETEAFSKGTKKIAEYIAALDCTSIIGGGDTAAAIAKFNLEDKMTHISTGGGASLEFLEGKALPGIAALTDK